MKNIILIGLLIWNACVFSQTNIDYIELDITKDTYSIGPNPRLRIILEFAGYKKAKPRLRILDESIIEGKELKEEKSMFIFKKEYNAIIDEITKINFLAMLQEMDTKGFHGSQTKLEISDEAWNNSIEFNFWSPDLDTEERGLTHYHQAIRLIILAADLNPADYL